VSYNDHVAWYRELFVPGVTERLSIPYYLAIIIRVSDGPVNILCTKGHRIILIYTVTSIALNKNCYAGKENCIFPETGRNEH